MSRQKAAALKERIQTVIAQHHDRSLKTKEIAKLLSIANDRDYQLLRHILRGMRRSSSNPVLPGREQGSTRHGRTEGLLGIVTLAKDGGGLVRLSLPEEGTISIPPRFLGTALTGDTVRIALFAHPTNGFRREEKGDQIVEGEIVEVLERSGRPIVGVLEKSKHFFFVVPDDRRVRRDIYIAQGKTKGGRPGDKVVALVDSWESQNLNPEGHVVEVLGKSGEVRAEMASVAKQFNLPLTFPKEVLAQAEQIPEAIPREEYRHRLDLRKTICFTIDPEDAKDFDDAVSLESLPNGDYHLGVHIADVSHYFVEGSALDAEAFKRGTSVYLADEVIPMLPEKLSNNLCSLRPREDRLTYSALIVLSPQGTVRQFQIARSVIHSKRRFTYEEVQKTIESGRGEFSEIIQTMRKLSQTLLGKRMKAGSIDFESAETKFRFDEKGKPSEIVKKARLDAHRLVEEFMLLANKVVAG